MKLSSLAAQTKSPYGQTVLLYGPPKVGKTEAAGQLAKKFNVLWFDLENGIQTLVKTSRLTPQEKEKINVISVPDTKSNPIAIETMLKVFTGAPVKICEEHGKVACMPCMNAKKEMQEVNLSALDTSTVVVVDSLTQLNDSALALILGQDLDKKAEYDHWHRFNQRIAMLLSFIQQARYHVLFIGHAKEIEQDNGINKLGPVGGTKVFSSNVPKYFGHVVYADYKGGKFVLNSHQSQSASAIVGTRSDLKLGTEGALDLCALFK